VRFQANLVTNDGEAHGEASARALGARFARSELRARLIARLA
jgi:hypothetical protein